MSRIMVTKSLATAVVMGIFAAHTATAQQTQKLPPESTTHFIYFSTGSHALTPADQDQIRDVAGMMQSTPTFVASIIGKADSLGSAEFNEHLSQQRAEEVFESLLFTPTRCRRAGYNCAGQASAYHSDPLPMKRQSHRTGWLRLL
jgi:hypothetical protein